MTETDTEKYFNVPEIKLWWLLSQKTPWTISYGWGTLWKKFPHKVLWLAQRKSASLWEDYNSCIKLPARQWKSVITGRTIVVNYSLFDVLKRVVNALYSSCFYSEMCWIHKLFMVTEPSEVEINAVEPKQRQLSNERTDVHNLRKMKTDDYNNEQITAKIRTIEVALSGKTK